MAIGDDIGGARTTTIMRRTNRIEDDLEYGSPDSAVKVLGDYTKDVTILNAASGLRSNNDGMLYFMAEDNPNGAVFKCSETLSVDSATKIIDSSTSPDDTAINSSNGIEVFNDVIAVFLQGTPRRSVRTYDTDGNKIADLYDAPSGPNDYFALSSLAVLSDGNVAASARKIVSGSSVANGILLLPSETFIDLSSAWSGSLPGQIIGCENGIIAILPDAGNNELDINLYNNSMSLQKTFVVGDTYSDISAPYALARQNELIAIESGTGILWLDTDLGFMGQSNGLSSKTKRFAYAEDWRQFEGIQDQVGDYSYSITPTPSAAPKTEFFRYPANYPTSSRVSLGTFPDDTELTGQIYRPHSEEIKDIRGAIDAVTTNSTAETDAAKGKTTGSGGSTLVDSSASFTSTVKVGDVVFDLTNAETSTKKIPQTISSVDSDTTLTLSGSGFNTGDQYLIRDTLVLTGLGADNVFKAAGFDLPYEWQPSDDDLARILESIYSGIESVLTVLETSVHL